MMVQRASEAFRHGKTEQEDRLTDAFHAMNIGAKRDMVVCFICGQYFKNLSANSYPSGCQVCSARYNGALQYCMPDILLKVNTSKGVILVNGGVHEKSKVRKKDIKQIAELKFWGYQVYVIKNELINNSENAWLRAIALGVENTMVNTTLYSSMHRGEKELVGLG